MRACVIAMAAVLMASAAEAKIAIAVDKDAQQMTVAVDGVARYVWPVSTGNPSHETPSGSFQTFRMEEDHYSKEFDDAPMPHAIFFTKSGHAIHGTDSVNRLGSPASHGCVRLSRANAATLFAMVKADGVLNTTVSLTGSSTVALMRNPKAGRGTATARRDPDGVPSPDYDTSGNPVTLDPLAGPARPLVQRRPAPQVADGGYVYGYDGGGYAVRRGYDAAGNPVGVQPRYYVDRGGYGQPGYGYQPQYVQPGYVQPGYAPRGYYQRGWE